MGHPLLDLGQEWHRQRAQLRAGHQRPPPLVTAGLDLVYDRDRPGHHRVNVVGMALVFGLFPATAREFVALARSRLRLGGANREELDGVLGTRIQALWAWLPTMQQDCYLELDHATDLARLWLIGPGRGEGREIDLEREEAALDAAFLAALVITSARHWGGADGLAKLVERFGRQPLLVAAQVAESCERSPKDPAGALVIAQTRWPQLTGWNEGQWDQLADREHPWVSVQLGRLALRLGLLRAARTLLTQAGNTEAPPVAWFDLGQANDALDDLAGAEDAFARYTALQGEDPDGWRRLLFVRVRSGHFTEAGEALRRYRATGANDGELAERLAGLLRRGAVDLAQRARLAGWLGARVAGILSRRLGKATPAELGHGGDAQRAAEVIGALGAVLVPRLASDGADHTLVQTRRDHAVRTVLLALPPAGQRAPVPPEDAAEQALIALRLWADHALSGEHGIEDEPVPARLLELARVLAT